MSKRFEVGSLGGRASATGDASIEVVSVSAADASANGAQAAGMARAMPPKAVYISWVALALMTTSSVASLRPRRRWPSTGSRASSSIWFRPSCSCCRHRWSPPSSHPAGRAASTTGSARASPLRWVPRGVVPVRYDDLLLSEPARVRGEHPGVCVQPRTGHQRRVDRIGHRGRYWSGVWISSRGTKGVAGLASGGLIIGTLIPGALLILLGVVFLGQGNPSAAPMTPPTLLPAVGRDRQPGAHREQLPVVLAAWR